LFIKSEGNMTSYQRALVILNPSSGQHEADETQRAIEARLREGNVAYETRTTSGAGDALRWAEAAPVDGFDLVVAAGGDGTIMEAMSGLIRSKSEVPLAQIPAGTANLLARALTIPTELDEALETIFTGRAERLDVGYLPAQDRYFALVAGCGYDAQMIGDATRGLKNVLGFGAYLVTGLKNLFTLRRAHIELTIDGERRLFRANTVMIVNVGQIGDSNLKLGANIQPHDGKLDVLVATSATVVGAIGILLRILTGRFEGYRDLHYLSAKHITINAKPPLPTQVDGEALGETPLEARAVPNGALLIVPESYRPGGTDD
jgi:YegS/Rv2252/BmrU family lipid kinase